MFDDGLANLALAVGRITDDQLPFEHQPADQIVGRLRFVGVRRDGGAGQDLRQHVLNANQDLFRTMLTVPSPSKPTQSGTNHGRQHGRQRMTPSQAPASIGNSLEKLQQAPGGLNIHGKTFAISRTNNGGTCVSRQAPKISS